MKKIKPALLDNPSAEKTYVVRVELSGGDWAELHFSVKEIATGEYNRIRAQGVYGGMWISTIEMGEL
jgi:hypothetical protein